MAGMSEHPPSSQNHLTHDLDKKTREGTENIYTYFLHPGV